MQSSVSPLRLNLLRGGYLLLIAGLGPIVWPELLGPAGAMSLQRSVVVAMLCALSLLSLLGLRYPLRMLPLLFFEMAWKTIWLSAVALRLWLSHHLDSAAMEMTFECLVVIAIFAVTPWDYVVASFIRRAPDAWRRARGELNEIPSGRARTAGSLYLTSPSAPSNLRAGSARQP